MCGEHIILAGLDMLMQKSLVDVLKMTNIFNYIFKMSLLFNLCI